MVKFEIIRNLFKRRNYAVTFCYATEQWLQQKKITIKQSTYSNYVYAINRYIFPTFKNMKINDLENYDFNKFVMKLIKGLSTKTVRDIICILKSILRFIEDEYDCNFKIHKISSPKIEIENLMILSPKEKNKLENYCKKNIDLRKLGILLCLNTGLRIGEVCALRWKDINLDKRILYVNQTLQRIYDIENRRTKVIIDTPKTAKSVREIPISNKLYLFLVKFKKKFKDTGFFLTGNETYLEPRNYQKIFKVILKKCRIKSYKFHILRHTFATNCIEVGMDIKSLSEILGHSSVEITLNRYVHSSYKNKKKYLEKL